MRLSDDSSRFDETSTSLWTSERESLRNSLRDLSADLEVVYERLVDEVQRYSHESRTAVADSMVVAHCFREFIRLLPEYMTDSSMPKGKQNEERNALAKLNSVIEAAELPESVSSESAPSHTIPSDLYEGLLNYKRIRTEGSHNAERRIASALGSAEEAPSMAFITLNEAYSLAQGRAHLNRDYARSLPTKGEFLTHLDLLEKSLRTRLESIFDAKDALVSILDRVNITDSSGAFEEPSEKDLKDAMAIMSASSLESFFFGKLKNPLWLHPLIDSGVFRNYQEAVKRDEPIQRFLPEPYLVLCIDYDPETVLSVMQELCRTGTFSSGASF